jgi:hypothetical protein
MATRGLIDSRDQESVALIVSRISAWRTQTQVSTLQEIAVVRGAFLDVARELLRATIKSAKPAQQADSPTEAVAIAATLLAKTSIPADRQMLLDLASVRPKSWGVWMALAYGRSTDLARSKIASSVYPDPGVTMAVRVAAASAAEQFDGQALSFALAQVQAFLDQYSGQDEGRMLADAMVPTKPNVISDSARKYFDFLSGMPMLGALFVLQADSAQQITFRYLNVRNQSIRDACTLAAVVRWPDRWLKTGQSTFSDREYADLLAIVAAYHPELTGAVSSMITPARMDVAKSRVAKGGLGTIQPAGMMFIGF